MKKNKVFLSAVSWISLCLLFSIPTKIYAKNWEKKQSEWLYKNDDASYARKTWKKINGKWYYFDENAYMQKNWQYIDKKWYFLNPTTGIDEGSMLTGWQWIDGNCYFLEESGSLAINTKTKDGYMVDNLGRWVEVSLDGKNIKPVTVPGKGIITTSNKSKEDKKIVPSYRISNHTMNFANAMIDENYLNSDREKESEKVELDNKKVNFNDIKKQEENSKREENSDKFDEIKKEDNTNIEENQNLIKKEDNTEENNTEENNTSLNYLEINILKDDLPLKESWIRLMKWDDNIPSIVAQYQTDEKGSIKLSDLKANSLYEIRMSNTKLKFDKDVVKFSTDENSNISYIDDNKVSKKEDLIITFKAYDKLDENLKLTQVTFYALEKNTNLPIKNVEFVANTLQPKLSSYKKVRSNDKGEIIFDLEGASGGKIYTITLAKNEQFNYKFEPSDITITIDENSEVVFKDDVYPMFFLEKQDLSHLRTNLENLIKEAQELINQSEASDKTRDLQSTIDAAKSELEKETIPYYVEEFIKIIQESIKDIKNDAKKELVIPFIIVSKDNKPITENLNFELIEKETNKLVKEIQSMQGMLSNITVERNKEYSLKLKENDKYSFDKVDFKFDKEQEGPKILNTDDPLIEIKLSDKQTKSVVFEKDTQIPRTYDLRNVDGNNYVTSIKNQYKDGGCRAFASLAALESHILMKHSENLDLSENNMEVRHGYFYNNKPSPENARLGRTRESDIGYLISDKGPILEEDDVYRPFLQSDIEVENGIDKQEYYNSLKSVNSKKASGVITDKKIPYRVTGFEFLKSVDTSKLQSEEDLALRQIKQAIMENGAVVTDVYISHDSKGTFPYTNEKYYNPQTFAYYTDGKDGKYESTYKKSANHALTIVGWDDDFSKDKFVTKPSIDGAWIVKDSQGESFGDNGFYYVSFASVSMTQNPYVFTQTVEGDTYKKIYQHDEIAFSDYIENNKYAPSQDEGQKTILFNRYKASEDGTLTDIGFFTTKPNAEYEVYLVPDFSAFEKEVKDFEESDYDEYYELIQKYKVFSGTKEKAGYHLMNLVNEKQLDLSKNKDFALGIWTKNPNKEDNKWDMPVESSKNRLSGPGRNSKQNKEETYTFSFDGFMDLNGRMSNEKINASIKGYIKNK